jgi:dTDP-4-dehydrorhamnose reductase
MVVEAHPDKQIRRPAAGHRRVRLLMTGRAGQLAQSLAHRAAGRADLELRFAARPQVDLAQPGSIAAAIRRERPDIVINAAAYTAVDEAEDHPEVAHRINADAAGEAAGAAAEVDAGIIQISTDYVFGGGGNDRPYRENDPMQPLGVYGRSKLAGEELVRAANPRHAILRTAWLYSPFGWNFVKSMVAAARARPVLTVVDDQHGSPTSALDLADAVLALVERWRGGTERAGGVTYHVAGSGVTSWCGLAEAVIGEGRQLGLPAAEVRPIRTEEWPTRAERPRYSALDSGKFAAEIGFSMPGWRTSVGLVVRQLAGEAAV